MKQSYLQFLASSGWNSTLVKKSNQNNNDLCSSGGQPWRNPTIFGVNVIDPHTPLLVFDSKKDCIAFIANPFRRHEDFTSKWVKKIVDCENPTKCKFKLFNSPRMIPDPISTIKSEDFDNIIVPSNWQIHNFGTPIYTNIAYPWKRKGGIFFSNFSYHVPEDPNPTGVYIFTFDVKLKWIEMLPSRLVYLILHGVSSAVQVWLNDKFVGYAQDSMTESEFEISEYLSKNVNIPNKLVLIVHQWSDGSYLEDQDQWWLSGVFRDIELQCRPCEGIIDYTIQTNVFSTEKLHPSKSPTGKLSTEKSHAGKSHSARITVSVDYAGKNNKEVRITLMNATASKTITVVSKNRSKKEKSKNKRNRVIMSLDIPSANLWSPTNPYLYIMIIELIGLDGKPIQAEIWRVGVRSVEIINGQLCVNNDPLTICGINRHEHDPYHGKVMTESRMVQDIQILKRHNFNAVRCSHYPNVHRWYELCDQYGLYVVDEANMETHGFAIGGALSLLQVDPNWKDAILSRSKSMVMRAKNYSCIIMWSLGNEAGCGPNTRSCADWIRDIDPTRPIQYESGIKSGDSPLIMGDGQDPYVTDIVCPMYYSPMEITKIVASSKENRPLILCEYAHAMGNSSGNLHLYWDLFMSKNHPQLQGGFIWDFVDQGLVIPSYLDGNYGYGGDFGKDSGMSDSTFCINGMVWPDRSLHPAMQEVKYLQQPLKFEFLNQRINPFMITVTRDSSRCPSFDKISFELYIMHQMSPRKSKPISSENAKNYSSNSDKMYYFINLPWTQEFDKGCWIYIQAVMLSATPYSPIGHVIAFQTFEVIPPVSMLYNFLNLPIQSDAKQNLQNVQKLNNIAFTYSNKSTRISIRTSKYKGEFNLTTGKLDSMSSAENIPLLEYPLRHCFYRAVTDNDLGGITSSVASNAYRSFASQWRSLGLNHVNEVVKSVQVFEKKIEVISEHIADKSWDKKILFQTITNYTFKDKAIIVDIQVNASRQTLWHVKSLPRIGVEFIVPFSLSQVRWLGCGPHENYPDRKASAGFGVYEMPADTMHTPYIHPTENGGRADVLWCALTNPESNDNSGLLLTYSTNDPKPPSEIREGFKNQPSVSKGARPAGTRGAQLSVSKYSLEHLENAKHQHEIAQTTHQCWHVHLDTAHMGLGGDCSWLPKTHEQYLVYANEWTYSIRIEPCQFKPGLKQTQSNQTEQLININKHNLNIDKHQPAQKPTSRL